MDVAGISVKDKGATGDGVTDDALAFQAALDSGFARIVVPFGTYLIGQGLLIGSDTELIIHPHARIKFGDGAGQGDTDFLLTNRDHTDGNSNILIAGGVWDGNNPGNTRGPDRPGSYTGVMLNFTNVKGLTLRKLRLLDAESYFIRLGRVSNFLIERIAFEINNLRPNQDGVHVSGHCEDGIIRGLSGVGAMAPNDDLAALLADDALERAQNQNGAFNGPIRRIRVEHLRATSCHSFVRLLSVDHPIEDVEIHDVEGGCRCCAINMDACRDCRVKLFKDADRPDGVGMLSNIRVADMNVHKASDSSHQPLIDFRTHADNFRIERFARNAALDVSPDTPTLHIAQAGGVRVKLEGLAETVAGETCGLLVTPTGQTVTLARDLTGQDSLTLARGGFDKLTVDRA